MKSPYPGGRRWPWPRVRGDQRIIADDFWIAVWYPRQSRDRIWHWNCRSWSRGHNLQRPHDLGKVGLWVAGKEKVGGFVADERVIGEPLDGTALGAGVAEGVPRWQ